MVGAAARMRTMRRICLEGEPQSQLQNSRLAGAGDAHEVRAILSRCRVAEVHSVQGIKDLKAELGVEAILHGEASYKPGIESGESRAEEGVAA